MIPFYKAVSLILRVLSKPLFSYTKRLHSTNEAQSKRTRLFFIHLGNSYHKFDLAVNRKFVKNHTQFAFKPLSDDLALERGIEFFYELLFYCLVIGVPVQSAQKTAEVNKNLSELQEGIQQTKKLLCALKREYLSDFL